MTTAAYQDKFDPCRDVSLQTPFENIALAFSGGGFRAASYATGVLSYFDNTRFTDPGHNSTSSLLEKVRFISSASGGTIANAMFALCVSKGMDFNACYHLLLKALQGDAVLTAALQNLNDDSVWKDRKYKKRNLINAFATVYDSTLLFDGKVLEELKRPGGSTFQLEEVCFGATEFYTGLPFRQQVKMAPDVIGEHDDYFLYGNYNINLAPGYAKTLKLADLLAASSCFPAGFEPLIFPDDFCYGTLTPDYFKDKLLIRPQTHSESEKKFIAEGKVGLMDGGITDNQGLESLMLADQRRRELLQKRTDAGEPGFKPFDLMLVNDVGSFYMDPYSVPEEKSSFALSLATLIYIAVFVLLGGISLLVYAFYFSYSLTWACVGTLLTVFPALLLAALRYLNAQLHSSSNKSALNLEHNFSDKIVNDLVRAFKNAPIPTVIRMLKERGSSILMLNNSVFMKRIKQVLYNRFFEAPSWKNRRKGNHIYDLANDHKMNRAKRDSVNKVSDKIGDVAQRASDMATTLWFDKEQKISEAQLRDIVSCGQFTTCYNLLDYIQKLEKSRVYATLAPEYIERLSNLKTIISADWDRFNADPFFLYDLKLQSS